MKQSANARFAITSWEEKPWSEAADQPRLTRASVARTLPAISRGKGRSST